MKRKWGWHLTTGEPYPNIHLWTLTLLVLYNPSFIYSYTQYFPNTRTHAFDIRVDSLCIVHAFDCAEVFNIETF